MSRPVISHDALVSQLSELGVRPGGGLLVHTSFRAVRPVEGGPTGLIHALQSCLGPEGTLVLPSWGGEDDVPFDPAGSETSEGLGVLPRLFWRLPGVKRSSHLHAFAARGPLAEVLVSGPMPLPPHTPESPVGKVFDHDGQVLLLGVNHDANTTIHLAELMGGVPYRIPKYCTVLEGGVAQRVDYGENDHCCERFRFVDGWLEQRGLQRQGTVGHATARLVRSRDVVDVVLERLRADPLVFLHPAEAGCEECLEARASIATHLETGP